MCRVRHTQARAAPSVQHARVHRLLAGLEVLLERWNGLEGLVAAVAPERCRTLRQ